MNIDAAQQCLDKSKQKFQRGDSEAALRFAKKALALHSEFEEARIWLEFVEKQQGRGKAEAETESSSSAAANGGDSSPRLRQRKQQQPPTTSSKDSLKDSSAAPPPPPRPYTQDQVDAIKDIKRHKDSGDLYSILGLQKSCDEADIKRAYRKLALKFHPDKCGAPGTDEAFKAIGHAFAVLSDESKRANYDRYGIDSESRASSSNGGGGGHPGFHGFQGTHFEGELSPEDIFKMFFGDLTGSGLGSANIRFGGGPGGGGFRQFQTQSRTSRTARQQTHFGRSKKSSDLSSCNMFYQIFLKYTSPNFGCPARYRQEQEDDATAQRFQLFQLLPLLLMLFFSFSSLFFGGDYGKSYSLYQTNHFTQARKTIRNEIPYFVSEQWKDAPRGDPRLASVERSADHEYIEIVKQKCRQERERKNRRIAAARSWFSVDMEKLRQANEMNMENCEMLRNFRY